MNRNDLLTEAARRVTAGQEKHGKPENVFEEIADYWSTYLDKELSASDVCNMMILLKIARDHNGEPNIDNAVDIAGYAACMAEVSNGYSS